MDQLRRIGIVGLSVLSPLLLIAIWRTVRFLTRSCAEFSSYAFKKRLLLHTALVFAIVVDLPMYTSFILYNRYTLFAYSFHRLESASLFLAFSITISDWAGLLYDIQEYELYPFLLRKATLISINVIYLMIALLNFVMCFTYPDFDTYTGSVEYLVSVFFQISVSLLLTFFMLSAGLKLALRIHGAAGLADSSQHQQEQPPQQQQQQQQQARTSFRRFSTEGHVSEFRNALFNLNLVMATCSICITMQATLLILDYAMGYVDETNKTVGPTYFYWACYFWIPMWGVVLSLLYLARTHSRKQRKGANARLLNASDNSSCCEEDLEEDSIHRGGIYSPPDSNDHHHRHYQQQHQQQQQKSKREVKRLLTADSRDDDSIHSFNCAISSSTATASAVAAASAIASEGPISSNERTGSSNSATAAASFGSYRFGPQVSLESSSGQQDATNNNRNNNNSNNKNDNTSVWAGDRTFSNNTSGTSGSYFSDPNTPAGGSGIIGSFDSSTAGNSLPSPYQQQQQQHQQLDGASRDFGGVSSIVSDSEEQLFDATYSADYSADNSMSYRYRDTNATNQSELYFRDIKGFNFGPFTTDASFRVDEEAAINGSNSGGNLFDLSPPMLPSKSSKR